MPSPRCASASARASRCCWSGFRAFFSTRHSRVSGNPVSRSSWMPACAGMTQKAGPSSELLPVACGAAQAEFPRVGDAVDLRRLEAADQRVLAEHADEFAAIAGALGQDEL